MSIVCASICLCTNAHAHTHTQCTRARTHTRTATFDKRSWFGGGVDNGTRAQVRTVAKESGICRNMILRSSGTWSASSSVISRISCRLSSYDILDARHLHSHNANTTRVVREHSAFSRVACVCVKSAGCVLG